MIRAQIRQWLDDLRQVNTPGTFARNAASAFSGTAVVVLSQIILTPIIARIYGPEVYGLYGIFISLCMNLATVADLGYTNAYVLPREDADMEDLFRGNLMILGGVMIALIPVLLLKDLVYDLAPSWSAMGPWFYLLPLGVAVQLLPSMCTHWLIRKKEFAWSSSMGGGSNLVLRLFNIAYGTVTHGAKHGLILGEVLVRGASLGFYWRALRPHGVRRILGNWHWPRIRSVLVEYRNYPQYIFPERWVALLGLQLPIFLLSSDPAMLRSVGQFAMASSLLLIPLRLFGFSLGTVFRQKVADTHRQDPADLARITGRFFERLMVLGVVPFAAVAVFGDVGFRMVLGSEWTVAGIYAAWMAVFFYYRMLVEPIIGLMNVQRREVHQLMFQSTLTLLRFGVLGAGIWWFRSVELAIVGYGLVSTLGYVVLAAYLLKLAGAPWAGLLIRSVGLMAVVTLLFMIVRRAIDGTWWPGV